MKTLLQKPLRRAFLRQASIMAVVMFALLPGFTRAQTFIPSTLGEYQFPGFGIVTTTTHSFTYTMSHVGGMTNNPTPPPGPGPYMPYPPMYTPTSDLTVHTWDAAGVQGGIAYINDANGSGTPPPATNVYDQGFIPYPNAQGIEASLLQDEMGFAMFVWGTNAAWYVVVSYWTPNGRGGPGHYMDVYIWNQPPPNGPGGLTLQYTQQLSNIPYYTRISQDGHNTYGFCITWEDPANGIDMVYGFMNNTIHGPSVSPVYTLPGTLGYVKPDVAFTHSGSGLNLQFLYYAFGGGVVKIVESTIPMQLGPGWTPPPPPTINDVNILPWPCPPTDLKTRIDAADHYSTDDWAYSYILPPACGVPNTDIFVRFDVASVPTTYCLTNGSMGNLPCDGGWLNDWPVCSFDATTNWLNVQWYTQYQPGFYGPANVGGYVSLRMDNTGVIQSPFDYLQVAQNPISCTQASQTPTIASSRQNDRTDYQFVAFANMPNMSPVMIVKDRIWSSPTFKGGGHPANDWSGLYSPTATPVTVKTENSITAYPNPFADKISLDISAGLMDKTLNVSVEDESGRVLDKFTAQGNAVNTRLATTGSKLNDGIYFVKVQSATDDFNQVIKIQKLAAH